MFTHYFDLEFCKKSDITKMLGKHIMIFNQSSFTMLFSDSTYDICVPRLLSQNLSLFRVIAFWDLIFVGFMDTEIYQVCPFAEVLIKKLITPLSIWKTKVCVTQRLATGSFISFLKVQIISDLVQFTLQSSALSIFASKIN